MYEIDPKANTQTNKKTKFVRQIRKIDYYQSTPTFRGAKTGPVPV